MPKGIGTGSSSSAADSTADIGKDGDPHVRNGFDNIERKYASDLSDEGRAAKREEQYNLAAYILDRKFPIRRRPSSEIPPMQAEGIRTFRNFDAINLLFRPDKLLEAYQRRRDEPVRGAEFHLKRH